MKTQYRFTVLAAQKVNFLIYIQLLAFYLRYKLFRYTTLYYSVLYTVVAWKSSILIVYSAFVVAFSLLRSFLPVRNLDCVQTTMVMNEQNISIDIHSTKLLGKFKTRSLLVTRIICKFLVKNEMSDLVLYRI